MLLYKPLGSEIAFTSVNIIRCSDRVSRGSQIVCLMVLVGRGWSRLYQGVNVAVVISSHGWSDTWCCSSLWVWYRVTALNCIAGHMMLLKTYRSEVRCSSLW